MVKRLGMWLQLLLFVCAMACPLMHISAQDAPPLTPDQHGKHFDRIIIIVLENQNYDSARKDKFMSDVADKGVLFTNYKAIAHPSYPNYVALISGNTFGLGSDSQKNFPDDNQHRTIANLMEDWRNYAEEYPAKPGDPPYLGDSKGRYARKHVPFLSFVHVQQKSFKNVVSVDTHDVNNAFVTDIAAYKRDAAKNPLPRYMFYSPNLDDDGHDPAWRPSKGLKKASEWLQKFLDTWLKLDDKLKGTLVVITYDEAEGSNRENRIYTVFLGDMVKAGMKVDKEYSHYSLLRTVEDNWGMPTLNSGDAGAGPIVDIWK
jgi:phosphoesterase family protein